MLGDDAYWASSLAKTLAPYAAAKASGTASTLASLQRFYAEDDYLRAARAATGFDAPSWSKLTDAAAAAAGVHAVLRDNPAFRGAAGIDTSLKGVLEANVRLRRRAMRWPWALDNDIGTPLRSLVRSGKQSSRQQWLATSSLA